MAGRAGRRGLDTIGHVIHLNNMFELPYSTDYENMVNGNPQLLQSKFQISYNLVLNFLQFNNNTLDFANKSMCNGEIEKNITGIEEHIITLKNNLEKKYTNPTYQSVIKNKETFETYIKLNEDLKTSKQKARKQIQRTLENISNGDKQFKNHLEQFNTIINGKKEIQEYEERIVSLKQYFQSSFNNITSFLQCYHFIDNDNKTTEKGVIATYIQETHCLAFTVLLVNSNYFNDFSSYEIAAILSCFSNIRIKEDNKIHNTSTLTSNTNLNILLNNMKNIYENYNSEELRYNIETSDSSLYIFELVNPILNWCESENEQSCKEIIKKCEYDFEIFTGEFIKAILKINNMVNELKNVAEFLGNVELLHKLVEIPELTLKFIATNQSLYI